MSSTDRVLLADIGGTNARFALADASASVPLLDESVREFVVADFPSLADAAQHYLDETGATAQNGVFAVAGRVDGYISDIPALLYYVKDKPELKVVERIPTGEKYSIMFNKNDPLATEVNTVITTLKQEGFIAKLHETWFGAKAEDTTSTVTVLDMPKGK